MLNELSKNTLKSYVKKASYRVNLRKDIADRIEKNTEIARKKKQPHITATHERLGKHIRSGIKKRSSKIELAQKKLAKESFGMISTLILNSYLENSK